MARIAARYVDPAEILPWDSAEGGYQGVTLDTDEIVSDLFADCFENEVEEAVLNAIVSTIGADEWRADVDTFS